MNPPASASEQSAPELSEWTEGWRIVLGCAVASGTGIVLLFFTFNLFVLPLAIELQVTRGAIGSIQALIITAALGAPVMGRLADLFGFKPVYLGCIAVVAAIEILLASFATSLTDMAIGVAVLGFFGIGSTAVVTTRPVSAHFQLHRGKALGLVAVGVSLTTMVVPLLLQLALERYGWRGGFVTLAALSVLVGAPAAMLIVPGSAGKALVGAAKDGASDWGFLRDRDFQLMGGALIVMGLATAGFVGQLSPMIQQEGMSAQIGALALTLFAVGQFVGRLGGGWLLDHFDPRVIAVVLTIIPGTGFLLLLLTDGWLVAALLAAGMIGLQQGAELDIFAYFTARRFPVSRYGTIYGALNGVSWIGNAAGILGVGLLHDRTGNYDLAQAIGMGALLAGAVLIALVKLPPLPPRTRVATPPSQATQR